MYKQVIVVRSDLKIGKGKLCVQVAHASLEASLLVMKKNPEVFERWRMNGAKKIVLKVKNAEELIEIYNKAKSLKLPCVLIKDAGLTQLEPGTITAVAIGPDEEEKINLITKNLKLL